MNLRDKILNANDIKSEKVTVEEWGVEVEVRGMTGEARAEIMEQAVDKEGNMNFKKLFPTIIIASTYDPETGAKVFEPADLDMLNSKSGGALDKVSKVAMKLSGLDEEAVKKAEKN